MVRDDAMMRSLLYQADHVMLTRVQKWSWLKTWAMNVAKRRGPQKAVVALARRLSVIMHRIWSEFRWTRQYTPMTAQCSPSPRPVREAKSSASRWRGVLRGTMDR